ncbi:hypothetical protein THRCLA_05796 [Thraustotheca clavata]|uniref:Uncharacterized protein n=1 Tax=Thraustotheca clavata TaxID=74557 RepID=A0A1V9ZTE0_9STRA|nr:hypothetical protein THRCLA_05796 [Thraustotheca clavata]
MMMMLRRTMVRGVVLGSMGLMAGMTQETEHASEVLMLQKHFENKRDEFNALHKKEENDVEMNGTWLMKSEPSFPHVLVISPQDIPQEFTIKLLRGGIEIPLDSVVPLENSFTSLTSLWIAIVRKLRTLQFLMESNLRHDLYEQRLLQHQLDLLTRLLQQDQQRSSDKTIPYFYFQSPRSYIQELPIDQQSIMKQWAQAITSQKLGKLVVNEFANHLFLAHVVWITSSSEAIFEFVLQGKNNANQDVCLLVRPQSEIVDNTTALEKLQILASKFDFEFSDEDSERITSLLGNWWADLYSFCSRVAMLEDSSLSLKVDTVCTQFYDEAKAMLLSYLNMTDQILPTDRKNKIDLLEKWSALQIACGLSNDSAQVLANPQALIKLKDSPYEEARLVLSAFAASGVTGERKFFDLFTSDFATLQPESTVAVGVVPCEAVDIVRGCRVIPRPILKSVFRELWSDDAMWTKVHGLQQELDLKDLKEQVRNYESEIEIAHRAYLKKKQQYEQAWDAFDDAEQAKYTAELYLEELKINAQRDHAQRLKSIYEK